MRGGSSSWRVRISVPMDVTMTIMNVDTDVLWDVIKNIGLMMSPIPMGTSCKIRLDLQETYF